MLHYAVVFFVIALIAALFGFGGIAAGAAGIAKILFVVFIILAIATFLFGRNRGAEQQQHRPRPRERARPCFVRARSSDQADAGRHPELGQGRHRRRRGALLGAADEEQEHVARRVEVEDVVLPRSTRGRPAGSRPSCRARARSAQAPMPCGG